MWSEKIRKVCASDQKVVGSNPSISTIWPLSQIAAELCNQLLAAELCNRSVSGHSNLLPILTENHPV